MSHLLPALACPALQFELNRVNECRTLPMEPTPLLYFLSSDTNTNGVLEGNVSPGRGKLRSVQLTWQQRLSESFASSVLTTDCTTTNEPGLASKTFDIDPDAGVEIKMNWGINEFNRQCMDTQDFIGLTLQNMFDTAARYQETKITQQLAAQLGKFVADGDTNLSEANTVKTIATKYEDGKFSEDGIQEITYSTHNSGFCDIPFVFGYNEIAKYMKKTLATCCAATGVDVNKFMQLNPAVFFPSFRVPTALGLATDFMAIDRGAYYLLTYLKFEDGAPQAVNDGALKMGLITDPKTGITYNYKAILTCGEELTIIISRAFQVVKLTPDDLYAANDRFFGTTGGLKFRVTNP